MAKLLISWIAYANDFLRSEGGQPEINPEGPNASMHRHYWKYDRHILLCAETEGEEDTKFEFLANYFRKEFPDHPLQTRYLGVPNQDLINLRAIQTKVESLLLEHREDEIHIFVSTGTPAMHTAWHFAHVNLGLNTHLLQLRPGRFSPGHQKSELLHIDIETSAATSSSIIRQQLMGRRHDDSGFKMTTSIEPVYEKAFRIAQTDAVRTLILGESGTGKEHLARHIHNQSARAAKKFVAVNCSALRDDLLESRLFGYAKGAFTGADQNMPGLFEEASGGTIFLDEIGDISPYMQQALLRVLQEGEILPVGAREPRKVDTRVIAATHKNLPGLCKAENFRWDLYYRIAVVELELPTLRDRGAREIKALLDHFLKIKQKELNKKFRIDLDKGARDILLRYPWPGNVRELENLVEHLYVFHDQTVTAADLPARYKVIPEGHSLRWQDVEKEHIIKVLRLTEGNKKKALETLGYGSINTLVGKMEKYGIEG